MRSAHPSSQQSALEAYFFALVFFLSLFSLAALGLLSLESFTPPLVIGGAILSLLASIVFFSRRRSLKGLSRAELGVLALVVVAFAFRANSSVYVYGGQDPGVYTNVASYFAERGTWIIKDPLLEEFEGRRDLRDYYVANSFRSAGQNPFGGWHGNMLPGVYLTDLDKNEWVSQFYHINTIWLSVGQWIFGQEWKGLTLGFLSSLTVIAAYLLTVRISSSPAAGLAAAFLLATNAAHSYIGTFPVSEAVAGFFFLSALSMLSAGWQFSSILPFSALFLTRITGFLTAPLLLISLAWMVIKRKDTKAAWTGLGILGAYALSFFWGLRFSGPYSRDIYRGKLGIAPSLLENAGVFFLLIGLLWILGCLILLRYQHLFKPLCRTCIRYRSQLTVSVIAIVLMLIASRGYLLAFTDHYANHRWFGARWHMAAQGVESLKYLSIYSLNLMLSPLGLLAFIVGLAKLGRMAVTRATMAPVAICTLGFFAALTLKQLTTPYLYYFGRYLVSELLPLAIICSAVTVYSLALHFPRLKKFALPFYCICVFALLYPCMSTRLRIREGRQFFDAMACVDQATPGRSVILIDKKDIPEVPIVTALRFSFQKATFAMREMDFNKPGQLRDLIDHFRSKGYAVHLLSSHAGWESKEGFTRVFRIPAIMRKVGGRAEAPTKISTLSHPIRLYSLQNDNILPEICQEVEQY